jgi:hypothetical protein
MATAKYGFVDPIQSALWMMDNKALLGEEAYQYGR